MIDKFTFLRLLDITMDSDDEQQTDRILDLLSQVSKGQRFDHKKQIMSYDMGDFFINLHSDRELSITYNN